MDPNINNNQNIEENKFLIDQIDHQKDNYNNIDSNLNQNIKIINLKKKENDSDFSPAFKNSIHFMKKKREKPREEKKKKVNLLNKNELQMPLNDEIEKRMNKDLKLEESIKEIQTELNNLNFKIENNEKIENFLENLNGDKEDIPERKDEMKNIMNNDSDENNEKYIKYSTPYIKFQEPTSLLTLTLEKENIYPYNEIESEEYPYFENTFNENKNMGNPFLNMEYYNEATENENNNNSDKMDEEKEPYSFRILTGNFYYKISKGTKELSVEFIIENNGKLPWPKNETFLLNDENKSAFKIEKFILFPLQPGEKCFVYFKFKNLDKYKPGLYKNYLLFNMKGKNLGNDIIIDIKIF